MDYSPPGVAGLPGRSTGNIQIPSAATVALVDMSVLPTSGLCGQNTESLIRIAPMRSSFLDLINTYRN